jgi:membrane-bound lytic murein transglycosylase D
VLIALTSSGARVWKTEFKDHRSLGTLAKRRFLDYIVKPITKNNAQASAREPYSIESSLMIASRFKVLTAILIAASALSGCLSTPEREVSISEPAKPAVKAASARLPERRPPRQTQQSDLWERIRLGMKLEPRDNTRVTAELKRLTPHPKYLTRVGEKARPFLYLIVEEVEARDLPTELSLIPIIESRFNPRAESPMKAAGLWQFMPRTGKGMGLKQNWWYDGRRDVAASTRAALDYLKQLNRQFKGDWELALAAYNAGVGRVQGAIKKNRRAGKPTDYWSLDLPRETQRYVPKLLAVRQLVDSPKRYGMALPKIENRPALELVNLDHQIDLALAAELSGIDLTELQHLNPCFKRWATDPKGPHDLLLPSPTAAIFREQIAGLEPDQRVTWARYKVRSGESLTRIARRHGTTTAVLRQANGLRGQHVPAGHQLLIPQSSGRTDRVLGSLEPLPQSRQLPPSPAATYHRVSEGETLRKIARTYSVDIDKLAAWNSIAVTALLRPGQWLRVSASAGSSASLSYRVRQGDSLSVIARRFNLTVEDLQRWNRLSGTLLRPGQILQLSPPRVVASSA